MKRFVGFMFIFMSILNAANTPTYDPLTLYQEVVQKIKVESINPVDEKRLINRCLDGMVNSVDQNGRYLNEEEYETLYLSSKAVAGIGLFLMENHNHIFVKSVVDHSPAQKANLQKGDELVQIDGVMVRDLSFEEVVATLRGAPNTKVKLAILKPNSSKAMEVHVMRKVIAMDYITSLMFEGDIAYIKISSFAQNALLEMLEDTQYLYDVQHHKLSGMILDLRDNPGGYFMGGIAITSLFLEKEKLIINVKSRHKDDKKQYKNIPQDYDGVEYTEQIEALSFLKTIPLVVLVNNDSSGSSEIVASVLQEYNRATIIGTPTFGKDTFATLFPLTTTSSAVKFATARWSTPKGKSVWPNGVTPNVEVTQEREEDDKALSEAFRVLKKR